MRESDIGKPVEPQFLKIHVLRYVLHLLGQGDKIAVRIIVHILREVYETFERYFGLVGLCNQKTVDSIKRIEEKMRIYLRLVERYLGFVSFELQFLAPVSDGMPRRAYLKQNRI